MSALAYEVLQVKNGIMGQASLWARLKWLYLRYPRWWRNVFVAFIMWGIGWYLVIHFSSSYDWKLQYTRYGVSLAMTLPTFIVHMLALWRDRHTALKTCASRWWLLWLVSHFPDLAVNWLMVRVVGWPFLAVYAMMWLPTAFYSYWVRDKYVFVPAAASTEETEKE